MGPPHRGKRFLPVHTLTLDAERFDGAQKIAQETAFADVDA